MSAFSTVFKVRSTRIHAQVRLRRHHQTGGIDKEARAQRIYFHGFGHGSVVVPGVADTNAVSCPVKALTRLDFPLFRRPKTAMRRRLERGVLFINPKSKI